MNDHDVEFDVTDGRMTGKLVKQSMTCIWAEVHKYTPSEELEVPINSTYFSGAKEDTKVKRARVTGTIRNVIDANGNKTQKADPNPNGTYTYKVSTMTRMTEEKRETKVVKRHKQKHNVEFM